MMQTPFGLFDCSWWRQAARALGVAPPLAPAASTQPGQPYLADVRSRLIHGEGLREYFASEAAPAWWLDNGGTGLAFASGDRGPADLRLLHEEGGRPLVSHFIDPIPTVFQALPWELVWPVLQSRTWIKLVWDRAHAAELRRFGVPKVWHLPMAAPDREYPTEPLDFKTQDKEVSFVGGQNSNLLRSTTPTPTEKLLPGALAACVARDMPNVTFQDIYYDLYRLETVDIPELPLEEQTAATARYFEAKLFYQAFLCLRNRDRHILYLANRLRDRFCIHGSGWKESYGVDAHPPLSDAEYFSHFRRSAINLALFSGNAESGINMRCFEIAAAGGFLLAVDQPELRECFTVGEECDVFSDEEDLLEKVSHYLAHPEERIRIALAGQRRALSEHLYSHRLRTIMRLVEQGMEGRADQRDDSDAIPDNSARGARSRDSVPTPRSAAALVTRVVERAAP